MAAQSRGLPWVTESLPSMGAEKVFSGWTHGLLSHLRWSVEFLEVLRNPPRLAADEIELGSALVQSELCGVRLVS